NGDPRPSLLETLLLLFQIPQTPRNDLAAKRAVVDPNQHPSFASEHEVVIRIDLGHDSAIRQPADRTHGGLLAIHQVFELLTANHRYSIVRSGEPAGLAAICYRRNRSGFMRILLAFLLSIPTFAQTRSRTITVPVSRVVQLAPDQVSVTISVRSNA